MLNLHVAAPGSPLRQEAINHRHVSARSGVLSEGWGVEEQVARKSKGDGCVDFAGVFAWRFGGGSGELWRCAVWTSSAVRFRASGWRSLAASKMFDWNDQDQVGETIWAEFTETEDHIVPPYPKGNEENIFLNFGDYDKKQKNVEAGSDLGSSEHTSREKIDFNGYNMENQSAFQANEECSDPQLDMEPWPDLPSLNAALDRSYNNESDQDSMAAAYMDDFNAASNLNKVRNDIRDGEPGVFCHDHEDKENESFLDCDWANIGDFDDLDRIFSNNNSIFCNEMAGNSEFLSASSDVISGTAQSIPLPDLQLNREQSSDHGSSTFHFNKISGGRSKQEEEIADGTVKGGEQAEPKNHVTSEYSGKPSQSSKKGDIQKKLLKSRKKDEERWKNKVSQNATSSLLHKNNQGQQFASPSMHTLVKTHLQQIFQPPPVGRHMQVADAENMIELGQSNQFLLSGCGYSYSFPASAVLPNVHVERSQSKPASVGYRTFTDSSKNSNSLEKLSDVPSRPSMMTPQEKIEKLRRRQQMQAMLAIQQQQQQFGHQGSGSDTLVPQECSPRKHNMDSLTSSLALEDAINNVSSSELSNLAVQDESQKISVMVDDPYLEETIYYQLQDALGKLDNRVRLCIRDSLLRLAQSAMERQNASDRNSTNKSNKDEDDSSEIDETNRKKRCPKMGDAETDTNPIDRTVAHLLFHRPSEKLMTPIKEELPPSPVPSHPDPKVSTNNHGSTSEENCQGIEEMEVQPP
ncbi:protein LNK2-like isoform X2 [Typha latifolia]|uniref:protein LNK2-like isoform X2 n=1 Tax=Typha latifolia TaxID=4733 RepID=UPI003C302BA7